MFGTREEYRRRKKSLITLLVVLNIFHVTGYGKKDGLIYILLWTPRKFEPFNFIDMGQNAFTNCIYKNCFLTGNHSYFRSVTDFDVIMFNVVNLEKGMALPSNRSQNQKYFMYGVEPAAYHPVPEGFIRFFNYTFTYKLSSNVTIPSIVVKDHHNEIIGPKVDMQWMKLSEMNETSDYVKNKLQNKRFAAAWIVSHCETPFRLSYALHLNRSLDKYGHHLDIFGKCGSVPCPKGEMMDVCYALIESDYYFYLAFENSFGEDYVTEKVLNALEHYAVPVVFGSANYSRFMPQDIYLDANILEPDDMAKKMNDIIKVKSKYYEYFKWHDHYSFHFSGEDRFTAEVCRLCTFLNNETLTNQTSVYDDMSEWWNEDWPTWPTRPTYAQIEPTSEHVYSLLLEEEPTSLTSKLHDFIFGWLSK